MADRGFDIKKDVVLLCAANHPSISAVKVAVIRGGTDHNKTYGITLPYCVRQNPWELTVQVPKMGVALGIKRIHQFQLVLASLVFCIIACHLKDHKVIGYIPVFVMLLVPSTLWNIMSCSNISSKWECVARPGRLSPRPQAK